MANSNYNHTISCMGDSLTHNVSLGMSLDQLYPAQLQKLLRQQGCNVSVRNFGKSGDTTGPATGTQGMTTRIGSMTQFSVPDIAVIYGGTNDTNVTPQLTTAQTTANLQSMVTSLQSAGVSKIIICGQHLANYSTGGDISSGSPVAETSGIHAATIAAQRQAVTNINNANVVYCDLYGYFKNRITGGQDTAGAYSWHIQDQNYHFNPYGCTQLATAIYNTIVAQGWLNGLQA